MDPVEDEEQEEDKRDALQQSASRRGSFSNPFESLLQSNSGDEQLMKIGSILRVDVLRRDYVEKIFRISLSNVSFGEGDELLMAKIRKYIECNMQNVRTSMFIILCLENFQPGDGFVSCFSSVSHLLKSLRILMFPYNEGMAYEEISDLQMKMVDPLMVFTLNTKPDIVHLSLQYGLRFFDETEYFDADDNQYIRSRLYCTRILLSDVIEEIFASEMWSFETMTLKTEFSSLPEEIRSKCAKFRFLMRSDSNPYVTSVKLAGLNVPQDPLPEMEVLRHIYDSLFPDMGFGLPKPPPLQHVCRCAIRRRLQENSQLPDGISKLELPRILHDYVNLLDD